ncbi:MAG: branched-chain amino acid ABC transporter permease [Deltaproteobacteria bacterium]|nr:branched-chain amino acid ABC transporter permease [Deltaproteobacteria bacterium]
MTKHVRHIQIFSFVMTVIAVQLLTRMTGTEYFLTQLTMSAYYSLVVIGLSLLMGYAGQISIGHAGFFAIGGYMSSFLTTYNLLPYGDNSLVALLSESGILVQRQDLYGASLVTVHPWIACITAVIVTLVIAYIVGGPVLRLKGHYLAMATLGLGIIIYRIAIGTPLFGAADGLSDVPPFALIPGIEVSGRMSVRVLNYYIAWALVVICMLLLLNLVHSRIGRALRSIHSAEDASNAMGVNTAKYKLHTFVLSAVMASVAGVMLAHYNGGIGPSEASVMKSVRYVAIVAIGGMANLWGALIMAVLLNFLSLRGYFGSMDDAVFGCILIIIMLFAPYGILRLEMFRDLIKKVRHKGEAEQA